MTQEIKNYFNLKENMIPNIKSSEGIGDGVLKKLYMRAQSSIMFSVLQETQYVYPFKSSVREIELPRFCHRETTPENYVRAAGLRSVHYKRRNRVFWSGFNADYYDLNWLSNNDNVQIVYVDNDTPTRDRIKFIDHGVGLGRKT
jgi:hypothetical protein